MDDYLVQKSMATKDGYNESFDVERNHHVRVVDSQQGSYTAGRVRFDCSVAANSSEFISLQGSYAIFPCTLDVQWPANNTADEYKKLACTLKNGVAPLIHSFSAQLQGAQIIQHSGFTNGRISYELCQKMTREQARKYEESGSFIYEDEAIWLDNANPSELGTAGTINYGSNATSRPKRAELVKPRNESAEYLTAARVSHMDINAVRQQRWQLFIKVDLDDLHDAFRQMPLMRLAFWTFEFILNAPVSCTVVTTADPVELNPLQNAAQKVYTSVTSTVPQQFLPIEFAPLSYYTIGALGDSTGFTATLTIGNTSMTACELHLRSLALSPEAEEQYLSVPKRMITYAEHEYISIEGIAVNGNVSRLLHSNISKVRKIVILPYMAGEALTQDTHPNEMMSAFSSFGCGALSSPYAVPACANLQCLLSGQAVFSDGPIVHELQHWDNFKQDRTNGGLKHAQVSGLVSYEQWSRGVHGAIVVDLSRIKGATDALSKNVTLQFRNSSGRIMNYAVFLYHDMELMLNCSTGSIVRENV